MPRSRASLAVSVVLGSAAIALKLAFAALAIATPVFAIWTASSLTAFHGGRVGLAALVGLLVFPGLPILWELASMWRRSRRPGARPPILTWFDRFVLRTLVVGLGFTAVVLVRDSATVFTALSTRGDWMLDGREGPVADRMRAELVRAARTLEWLHESTHRNVYAELVDSTSTTTTSEVKPVEEDLDDLFDRLRAHAPSPTATPTPAYAERTDGWPFVETLHPAVSLIPPEHQRTPEAIGKYLAQIEPDPRLRLKAAHDYVADRVAYDVVALRTKNYPDQSAEAVLASGLSVCAGYANLLAAIGNAAGIETVVVVGDTRDGADGFGADGAGHAWNAARLGAEWVLLDATWDAGHVGDAFEKEYSTEYLMAPPAAFGIDHFPDEERWQLRNQPLTRAEFLRQPAVRPAFFARGLRLRSPDAPIVQVDLGLEVAIDNPLGVALDLDIAQPGSSRNLGWCEDDDPTAVKCRFDRAGTYDVRLFSNHTYLGEIRVHAGSG
jgi:transglutaminase-like putative cysteine protease